MIAREAGIEPLADKLFADPSLDPLAEAAAFVNAEAGFADAHGGARRRARHPVRALGRRRRAGAASCASGCGPKACCRAKLMAGKDENNADVAKFRDYFDYDEPIRSVPSHRALAVFRGRTLEILDAKLALDEEAGAGHSPSLAEGRIAAAPGLEPARPRRPTT